MGAFPRHLPSHLPLSTLLRTAVVALCLSLFMMMAPARAESLVTQFLDKAAPGDLVPGADAYGPMRADIPVVPALKGGKTIGWVFLTSDFVSTTGYSGKPIHILAGISPEAVMTGAVLVKHSEPIVLVGIPEAKIKAVIAKYHGLDLKKEATAKGSAHDLDIVSGATVTVMVIDDSLVRSGIKAARALNLPGFAGAGNAAPTKILDMAKDAVTDWPTLSGDGSLRRILVDVATVNHDFAATGDPLAAEIAEAGPETDAFVDVWTGLASQPSIGHSLLGDTAYANLKSTLKPGEQAIFIAGAGRWSFKGSGYVRGGIFDRITLTQGDVTVRFHDRQHTRVHLEAAGAPEFTDTDLFIVPADSGFDPTKPWRLQLLVSRAVGPIKKLFLTYNLDYTLPAGYLKDAPKAVEPSSHPESTVDASAARDALWVKIWQSKRVEVVVLGVALALLTGIFFFQSFATKNERVFRILRNSFLVFTLVFVGWYANAQLSVVNLLAVVSALASNFRWETFLMDPLVFLLWFAVAAALIFWARGAYCGWLCPFGALQELTNQVARKLRVPQVTLPWGLHERLWAVKYIIFLGLFGLSLYSFELAERFAEIEPFKTSIILKFARPWPYVLFALAMLAPSLFIERFYCRYVCPLGGGLAIPARLHMFRWLKRYRECGNPCQTCANECPVDAIHPTGEINPNECISCLHCQVLYQHTTKCPVVVTKLKRRARLEQQVGIGEAARPEAAPAGASPHPGRPKVTYRPSSVPGDQPGNNAKD